MVICLERGADLQMAQLMPLPLTVSCFSKIQIGFLIGPYSFIMSGQNVGQQLESKGSTLSQRKKQLYKVSRRTGLISMFSFTFLVPAHPGIPRKWAIKRVARLTCWTQAQKGPGSNRSRAAVG